MPQNDDRQTLLEKNETLIEKQEKKIEQQEAPEKLDFIRRSLNSLALDVLDDRVKNQAQELIHNDKIDEAWHLLENEEQLKTRLDRLQDMKNNYEKYENILRKFNIAGGGSAGAVLDTLTENFLVEDPKTGKFRMRSWGEMAKDRFLEKWEDDGLWSVFTGSWEVLKMSLAYKSLKKYEKELILYKTGKEVGGAMKEKVEEVSITVNEAKNTAQNVLEPIKENPATREASRNAMGKFKEKMKNIFRHKRTVDPLQLKNEIQQLSQETIREGMTKGKLSFVKQFAGKHGFTFRTSGKFIAVEVLSKGLLESLRTGDISAFPETITSSSVLMEAIPGVGSWKSVERLFSDNGDPFWTKILDAGMNVVGDGILLAGIIGAIPTLGGSLAAGTAGRMGIVGAGKQILKTGMKSGLKTTLKEGGEKLVTKKLGKQIFKEGTEEIIEKKGKQGFLKEIVKSTGKWTLTGHMLEEAFGVLFPEGTVTRVATDIALDQLPPQQRRLVQMGLEKTGN
ncbi:hypothetical protein K9M59_01495 [Candidatus Gracilibacteria bacterium]|nr:hypothetical protein [Candidatus Gracilibacteria bacterium]MCF7819791.1 hypothetical protein [Candidatus Gracilibacteria bacterium]